MARPKNNQKRFQRGNIEVSPAQFDLEAILQDLLDNGLFEYNKLNGFFFSDLRKISKRLNMPKPTNTIANILTSYIKINAITLTGSGKNTMVYVNPNWLFYGPKSEFTDTDKYVGFMDAKIAYANLKQDQEIAAKYATKDETKEMVDSLNRKIANQQAIIGDITDRMSSLEQTVIVIQELVETGQKPPADVTVNGKDYHIDSQYQVKFKMPELPAHTVRHYDDENPF
jgi:hypothetical protein